MVTLQQSKSVFTNIQFGKGDWNGFLTLLTDYLAKIVLLPMILIGTFQFPPGLVFGRILSGMGVALLVGWIVSWHFGIVEEERILLEKYGEVYQQYLDRTPRWIGIPQKSVR